MTNPFRVGDVIELDLDNLREDQRNTVIRLGWDVRLQGKLKVEAIDERWGGTFSAKWDSPHGVVIGNCGFPVALFRSTKRRRRRT